MSEVLLSKKFRDFLRCRSASVEFLEGTTYAGKTTVGIMKFMFRVAASPKKIHIVSGLDTGTIEKNIINKELGIIDVFGSRVEYNMCSATTTKLAGKRLWAASMAAFISTR